MPNDNDHAGTLPAAWRDDLTGGQDSLFADCPHTDHNPWGTWDPMVDYAMMIRFNRGFSSLLHANKPTVAKLHGFAVAGGTDIVLYADQIICAADTKIGYLPTRVWGIPAAGMWAHRLGDQRAKRLLFTGDCLTGKQAEEWGLAVEAPSAERLDERTEACSNASRRCRSTSSSWPSSSSTAHCSPRVSRPRR